MPAKKTNKEIVVNKAREVSLMPAAIITQSEKRGSDVDIPEFLKGDDAFTKEAPDGFSPLIDFGDVVGRYIVAQYVGFRAGIGPNKSFMYDFDVVKPDKSKMLAALWGSTILDTKMAQLKPQPGDWVFIQYLGVVDTQRGMNPAKDYRLKVVNPEKIKGMYWGNP